MMKKYIFYLMILLTIVISCQKEQKHSEPDLKTEIQNAFNKQEKKASIPNIENYIDWDNIKEYKNQYYIPINNKNLYTKNDDNLEISLYDKVWIQAENINYTWKFKLLTVFPNDFSDYKESGTIYYEDMISGKLSHVFYHDNKFLNSNKIDIYKIASTKVAKEMY